METFGISSNRIKNILISVAVGMGFSQLASIIAPFIKTLYVDDDSSIVTRNIAVLCDKYYEYSLPLLFGFLSLFLVNISFIDNSALLFILIAVSILYIPLHYGFRYFISILKKIPFKYFKRFNSTFKNADWRTIYRSISLYNFFYSVVLFFLSYLSVYIISLGLNLNFSFLKFS